MVRRIGALVVKEIIQLARDRMMTIFIALFPVAQLLLLAQAAGRGIHDLPLAVVDQDRSAQSRAVARTLDQLPSLTWLYQPADVSELTGLIEAGRVQAGVVIPAGFGEGVIGRRLPTEIQVILDGSNSLVAGSIKADIESAVTEHFQRQAAERGVPALAPVTLSTTARYNPDLNSRLFTIPAQLGFIVYQVTLAVASLVFARERELGTLEQLLVTPLRRLELISGKAVMAWLAGSLNFVLMYGVVTSLYQIPMRGDFGLLLALSLGFVAVECGFGIIISSFARNQQQAILYVFLLAMLDVALSGYLVPVKNMPGLFRTLALASPLQHYLVIVRSIMLKGAGLLILLPQVGALAIIGAAVGIVAARTATRSLE